mgnify:CR=1 FL=1
MPEGLGEERGVLVVGRYQLLDRETNLHNTSPELPAILGRMLVSPNKPSVDELSLRAARMVRGSHDGLYLCQ